MASIYRFLSVGKRVLTRQFGVSPSKSQNTTYTKSSSTSHPLLTRLLQGPNSSVKTVMDLEENLTLNDDAFSWEPFVTALRSSSPDKAQLVLEWKLEKMLKENERDQSHYSELISLSGKIQNIPFAVQVFTSMEAHGIRPTTSNFNSLISACLSSGNAVMALSLFEIMERTQDCKPNLATYNGFVSVYSKLGDGKTIEAWYSAGKAAGFLPNVQTYESLIAGSIKAKQFDAADEFYEEMVLAGVTPNVSILDSMFQGLCEQKKLSKVKEFLKFMLEGGWDINERMTARFLRLYTELGRVEEMEELLLVLMEFKQGPGVLSLVHCGIIRMYALLDRLDDLEYSVGRMLKQGISFTCPDDVEKVICSYFRREAYERLGLFLERIRGSVLFTRSTYDLLVAGYRRGGLSEKLDLVMNDMKMAGFS